MTQRIEQFTDNVRALEVINGTLRRCEEKGGFVYLGEAMGVLAMAILSDLEAHGLHVVADEDTP